MSRETGAIKWIIGMLLTPVGYVSLYIAGDGIWNTITHAQALVHLLAYLDRPGLLLAGLINIYVPTPDSLLASLIVYPVVGGLAGAASWYLATA